MKLDLLWGTFFGPMFWAAAILFCLFLSTRSGHVCDRPCVESGSLSKAIFLGLFFGFITYQTHDLTKDALVEDWPLIVVIVDIAWGMVLSGLVSAVTFLMATKVF